MPSVVTYAKKGPFSAISIPSSDPSVVLRRGESAVIEDKDAEALKKAFDSGALPGVKEYITIEKVTKAKAEAADKVSIDEKTLKALGEAGLDSPEAIARASDEELKAIKGVTDAKIPDIRKAYPAP